MSTPNPFSISRVVDAPRALVFLLHTDPVHIARWYGPAGNTVIKAELDLRPGGVHHYGLRGPDGSEMWGKQTFREIVRNEKLVYLQAFSDRAGGLTRHPLAPTWPLQMLATVTFEDAPEGKTKITVSWLPYESDEAGLAAFEGARAGMSGGFGGMFDNLDRYLAQSETELIHSRLLSAPRALIWKALTDPAQVNLWWGPTGFKNVEVEQDVRVGGTWRFKMVGPDGTVYPNLIKYLEIVPEERLTFDHGDFDAVHFRGQITLADEGGKTRISLGVKFADRAGRDGVVKYAIDGGQQTLAKLEAFLRG
jgi:uncharacterized protein YndB with AHSA1/START domain